MTDVFVKNIDLWRFGDHSLFIHDNDAVSRFMDEIFVEFPLLQDVRHCIHSGAGLADLWRYVVLWKYGGLYTDIDNAPGKLFGNHTMKASTDFFVEKEKERFPSQYFMAASPQHPVSYNMVQHAIGRLLDVSNIATQSTVFVTGPGACKSGVISFIGNGYPIEGNYTGTHNRTMTVLGSPYHARNGIIIQRGAVPDYVKKGEYLKMNMTHFREATFQANKFGTGNHDSCLTEVYGRSSARYAGFAKEKEP